MKYAIVIDGIIKGYSTAYISRYINGLPVYRPLVFTGVPNFNPDLEKLQKVLTIFNDRVEVSYTVILLTQTELDILAAEATLALQKAKDLQAEADVKNEQQVKNFVKMSIAEVNSYVDTNVTDLASAKVILKFLARMVLLLIKRELKEWR